MQALTKPESARALIDSTMPQHDFGADAAAPADLQHVEPHDTLEQWSFVQPPNVYRGNAACSSDRCERGSDVARCPRQRSVSTSSTPTDSSTRPSWTRDADVVPLCTRPVRYNLDEANTHEPCSDRLANPRFHAHITRQDVQEPCKLTTERTELVAFVGNCIRVAHTHISDESEFATCDVERRHADLVNMEGPAHAVP